MVINYKEKYEEVLGNASIVHKFGNEEIKRLIENLFPELVESEDEKIRKAIIEGLRAMKSNFHTISSVKIDDAINWLKKQGKQEEPQVYETEDGEIITYSESEGYKVIDPKFKVNDIF